MVNIRYVTKEDVEKLLPLFAELGYPCSLEEKQTARMTFIKV